MDSDDKRDDKEKVIRIFRAKDDEQKYSNEDYSWETQIDLIIQEQQEHIERLVYSDTQKTMLIEDLHRDIRDLQRTVNQLLRQLYLERKEKSDV